MKRISSAEFKTVVELDPAWATTLTEPVEITGFCNMERSPITHLSPLLHFTGSPTEDRCATFANCKDLKVAEGKFASTAIFSNSGIEKIGNLVIAGSNNEGDAAHFVGCRNLKVAEGTFPGFVYFNDSGVERIGKLNIARSDRRGRAATFKDCSNLKVARGTFPGSVNFENSAIQKIEDLVILPNATGGYQYLDFTKCTRLKSLPKEWCGNPVINMDEKNRKRLDAIQMQRDAVTKTQKESTTIEI